MKQCWECRSIIRVGDRFCSCCGSLQNGYDFGNIGGDVRGLEQVGLENKRLGSDRTKNVENRRIAREQCIGARDLDFRSCHHRFQTNNEHAQRMLELYGSENVLDEWEQIFAEASGRHSERLSPADARQREGLGAQFL